MQKHWLLLWEILLLVLKLCCTTSGWRLQMMDEHFVQRSSFFPQIIVSWLVWLQGRNPRSRASNWRSRNESHCFIGIPEIADRQILNMLSSIEGPWTAFRKPYLNTIALSPWSHCGETAEVTRTKQFWFRMQLHKASIPPRPWVWTTRGTFCLMSE